MHRIAHKPRWAISILLALAGCAAHPPAVQFKAPPAKPIPVEDFWYGVSTSAYQIEEPSPTCCTDWELFEKAGKLKYPHGQAVRSYTQTQRDIAALQYLGVTHYRFGIEWARVEPRPGQFDQAAIQHYVDFAKQLRAANITPIVCLWHFTFPDWLSNFADPFKHGWLHPDGPRHWVQYVERITRELSPTVTLFGPLNEPNTYALAVAMKVFPPGKSVGMEGYRRIVDAEAIAIRDAAKTIRSVNPQARILSIQNIMHFERDPFDLFGTWYEEALRFNFDLLDRTVEEIDYVGFNYYSREVGSPKAAIDQPLRHGDNVSDLGWIIDPAGLEIEIATLAKRYGRPLVILENGIADKTDRKRQSYLAQHLCAVQHTRAAGYDVRGYFHWTLMDNFEWHQGYAPKFGLFDVSPDYQHLIPKESANLYRALIRGKFFSR